MAAGLAAPCHPALPAGAASGSQKCLPSTSCAGFISAGRCSSAHQVRIWCGAHLPDLKVLAQHVLGVALERGEAVCRGWRQGSAVWEVQLGASRAQMMLRQSRHPSALISKQLLHMLGVALQGWPAALCIPAAAALLPGRLPANSHLLPPLPTPLTRAAADPLVLLGHFLVKRHPHVGRRHAILQQSEDHVT